MNHPSLLIPRHLTGFLSLFFLAGANVSAQETPSLVVTTADDVADPTDGETSLREAIVFANSDPDASEITFASPYFDTERIIDIDSALPAITATTTVTGPGADLLTIFGNFLHTAIRVTNGAEAIFTGVAFSRGNTGIFVDAGSEGTVRDCEFLENTHGVRGDGDINVDASRFVGNRYGLFDDYTSPATKTIGVSNCVFAGNRFAVYRIGRGTAIIANCSFKNNSEGIRSSFVNAAFETTAIGCVFTGSTTVAIGTDAGTINAINCTLSGGNTWAVAAFEGGVANLFNCTVTGNGIGLFGGHSNITLKNTIVAGNATNISSPGITNGGGNIIGGTAAEAGLQTSDGVNAVVLADNGGPTETIALVAGGPAVDGGDNSLAKDTDGNDLATDQRGQPRMQQGDAASSSALVDVGAYEYVGVPEVNPNRSRFSTLNGPIDLTSLSGPAPASGTFSGPGVRDGLLDPAHLTPGRHEIVYTITDGFGATNQSAFSIEIFHGYVRPDLRYGDSGNAGNHRGDNQYGGGQNYRAKTKRRNHTFYFSLQNDGNVPDTLVTNGIGFSDRDFRIKVREQGGANVSGVLKRGGMTRTLGVGEVVTYKVTVKRTRGERRARMKVKLQTNSALRAVSPDINSAKVYFKRKKRKPGSTKPAGLFGGR